MTAASHSVVMLCDRLLALHAEREQLHLDYGRHEESLCLWLDKAGLRLAEADDLPEGRLLSAISDRLSSSIEESRGLLAELARHRPDKLSEIGATLKVAAALIDPQDEPEVHALISWAAGRVSTAAQATNAASL
ncbi:hypothetical protein P7B02_11520 [Caulobacter segnis]|uniref:hypothetical protein n=1 Tax=Caulobacter segnis TaxID=88688 RepID=UPI00240FE8E1|nr:hypothetical protein [Caulobacter segnis]MDG2522170.1 hypothetical protein [Caulobacter segnis]